MICEQLSQITEPLDHRCNGLTSPQTGMLQIIEEYSHFSDSHSAIKSVQLFKKLSNEVVIKLSLWIFIKVLGPQSNLNLNQL